MPKPGKLLNDYAKESDWGGSFKKDSMAISASRTSHISVLPVRPKGIVIRSIEDLKRLMSYVYSGLLSTGVPNDFDRFKDIYNKAKSMNKVDIMINVIKHVINNNTRLESVLNDLVARAECSLKEYEKHGGDYILNLINSVNILRRLP
ncbi:hypothetical protein [Vulcanisaeta distributa]|uniref:hypothetical protein n=1 Tax=Vulcanisaeta distributa TaxID=164451 RepID=UPI0006D02D8E|nr:hypothetical protein [Vulcanisaeta distributa]